MNNIDNKSNGCRKNNFLPIAFVIFMLFAFFFAFFRNEISVVNVWILRHVGNYKELDTKSFVEQNKDFYERIQEQRTGLAQTKKGKKKKVAKKKVKKKIVTKSLDLPKTIQPTVTAVPKSGKKPAYYPRFPVLREYNGKDWTKEDTDITMTTIGGKLFFRAICHDSRPQDIVASFSEKEGGRGAYKDDSIELFLMKDKSSKSYCQYICSASGKSNAYYNKNRKDNPFSVTALERPKDYVEPEIKGERLRKGYKVFMKIDLSNLGVKELKPGDEFLVQVVRNYRGLGSKERVVLHLFPNYIYGGAASSGARNHDRRAFQPVKVKDGAMIK